MFTLVKISPTMADYMQQLTPSTYPLFRRYRIVSVHGRLNSYAHTDTRWPVHTCTKSWPPIKHQQVGVISIDRNTQYHSTETFSIMAWYFIFFIHCGVMTLNVNKWTSDTDNNWSNRNDRMCPPVMLALLVKYCTILSYMTLKITLSQSPIISHK